MASSILIIMLILSFASLASGATCEFHNELVAMSWKVKNNQNLTIKYEHTNLKDGRWTAIAFGNGPGMTNLESVIFARHGDDLVVRTGYTPKYGKVIIDDVAYVQIDSIGLNGNSLKVTISRPLGPAGPRNYSLDRCINWSIIPGGGKSGNGELEKHHGGAYKIKNVCAAACSTRKIGKTNSP